MNRNLLGRRELAKNIQGERQGVEQDKCNFFYLYFYDILLHCPLVAKYINE